MEIIINNITYPICNTLGAYREYKKISGKEVEDIKGVSDMAELLYCFVKVSARIAGKEFNITIEDFCDAATVDDLQKLNNLLVSNSVQGTASVTKKKK